MTVPQLLSFILGPIAAYLLGSIPFGLLIGLARGVDIRKVGSGNIGATNLGRTLGMRFFWYAFFLDMGKGLLPVLAVNLLLAKDTPAWYAIPTAAAAVIGHLAPIYLGFKGGKGVATSFGAVLGIWPIFTLASLAAAAVFLVIFLAYRYISLASITGSASFPIFVLIIGRWQNPYINTYTHNWSELIPLIATGFLMTIAVALKHRANIKRLLNGTEPKAGQKKTK